MHLMDGESEIMATDEQLTCRSYNRVLGQGVNVVDGKRQYSSYEDFEFIGNVQPVTGDDLILVPEGDRFNEQLFVYVPTTYQRAPETNDLVYRTEQWYQVQANELWGSYTKLRIQRVDVGPDRALGV